MSLFLLLMLVSPVASALDRDGTLDLQSLYDPVLQQISSDLPTWSAVEGLLTLLEDKRKLLLQHGNMTVAGPVTMTATVLTGHVSDDVATALVDFLFPPFQVSFDFNLFEYRFKVYKVDRDGHLNIQQEGSVYVQFVVEFSKSRSKIKNALRTKSCVVTVTSVNSNIFNLGITVSDIHRESIGNTLGVDVTPSRTKEIIQGVKIEIQKNFLSVLKDLVEPVFRGSQWTCKDPNYQPPLSREERKLDFRQYRTILFRNGKIRDG